MAKGQNNSLEARGEQIWRVYAILCPAALHLCMWLLWSSQSTAPVVEGWAIVLGTYLATLLLPIPLIRFYRQWSPIWRACRWTSAIVVGGSAAYMFGSAFWSLYQQAEARGYSPIGAVTVIVEHGILRGAQGLGLVYVAVFLIFMRVAKKWERHAVAAAPMEVGDTKSRLSSLREIREAGLFRKVGVEIARWGKLVARVPLGERAIYAAPGGGKGIYFVIPFLLRFQWSVIANDPKAQNFAVTHAERIALGRRSQGLVLQPWRTVYVADPYRLFRQPSFASPGAMLTGRIVQATVNPLDSVVLADGADVDRRLDAAIDAIISPPLAKDSNDGKYFVEQARTLIRGIAWAGKVSESRGQSLDGRSEPVSPAWIRDVLVSSSGNLFALIGWLRSTGRYGAEAAGILSRAGDREQGAIYNSAMLALRWLEDVNMRAVVRETSVNWDLILQGLADLYIICPVDQLASKQPWIHGLLKCFYTTIVTLPVDRRPRQDLAVVLDELARLGACQPVEEAVPIIRDAGCRHIFVFQYVRDRERYSNPDVFTSDVVHIPPSTDKTTIEFGIQLAGKRPVLKYTVNEGGTGQIHNEDTSNISGGRTISQEQPDVLTPDVFTGMRPDEALLFVKGLRYPTIQKLVPYFADTELAPLARRDPYHLRRQRE